MRYVRREISLFTILLLLFTLIIPTSHAIETIDENPVIINTEEYVEGVVIIQFDPTIDKKIKEKHKEDLGLTLEKKLKKDGLELHKLNKNKSVEEIVAKLSKKKGILFAEPDYILRPTYTPDDTYYDLMWGLNNTSNQAYDIDAPEAWDIQMGSSNVIVAVIDTGVQINHEDLVGQFVPGYDFYNNDSTVYDNKFDDHGTHVSGTIAALNNQIGVIGIAPNVKIMPLKFLGRRGGSTSDAIEAIYFAEDNGADIINASWGGGGYSTALKNAIESFTGPFVAAAGNGDSQGNGINTDNTPHYPSSYNSANIISVAAIDEDGSMAGFSNYGTNTVDVGAPGVRIASTYPNSYVYMNGTSMATPHVSGILALMLSQDLTLKNSTDTLIQTLYSTSEPLTSLNGKTSTGGLVNAYNALMALTGPQEDLTPPMAVDTLPSGSGVDINTNITIQFNEPLDEVFIDNTKITIPGVASFDTSVSDDTLTLTPTNPLEYETTYTVTILAGAVKDVAGNTSVVVAPFNFNTMIDPSDLTQPFAVTSLPTGNDVGINTNITVQFNEPLDEVFIDDTKITISGVTLFDTSVTGDTLILTPTNPLDYATYYTVTISAAAVKDVAGNTSVAVAPFSFTTMNVPTAPQIEVIGTNPSDGARNFKTTRTITITFNQDVGILDSSFVSIFNNNTSEALSTGVFLEQINATQIRVVHPKFEAKTNYTVTLDNDAVENSTGDTNNIYPFSFTTGKR